MNTLKFRIWDNYYNIFYYFDLTKIQLSARVSYENSMSMCPPHTSMEFTDTFISDKKIPKTGLHIPRPDPNTIEQFTGLVDKTGKEIYAGDILQNEKFKNKYEVCWDISGQWVQCDLNYGDLSNPLDKKISEMVIIGNIHETTI